MTRHALLGCFALCAACGSTAGADAGTPPVPDSTIEQEAAGYQQFTRLDSSSFPTQAHQCGCDVNVYANARALPAYRAIGDAGVATAFPAGSMLVKEMLGANGQPDALTVMYKQPPGYDSAGHDWWWGQLAPDGGVAGSTGQVAFCLACHASAPRSDLAFGAANGR
ncbi:MAG TPA: cytochrome P460 family protein [Myxococcales bacterium]|nr:cytochrome P460 family protein [Myxococcales bacterium]